MYCLQKLIKNTFERETKKEKLQTQKNRDIKGSIKTEKTNEKMGKWLLENRTRQKDWVERNKDERANRNKERQSWKCVKKKEQTESSREKRREKKQKERNVRKTKTQKTEETRSMFLCCQSCTCGPSTTCAHRCTQVENPGGGYGMFYQKIWLGGPWCENINGVQPFCMLFHFN